MPISDIIHLLKKAFQEAPLPIRYSYQENWWDHGLTGMFTLKQGGVVIINAKGSWGKCTICTRGCSWDKEDPRNMTSWREDQLDELVDLAIIGEYAHHKR